MLLQCSNIAAERNGIADAPTAKEHCGQKWMEMWGVTESMWQIQDTETQVLMSLFIQLYD